MHLALVVVALLVASGVETMTAPTRANATGGTYAWTHRDDATGTSAAQTTTSDTVNGALPMTGWPDELSVASDYTSDPALLARFRPPAGQALRAGVTYQVAGYPIEPTAGVGWAVVEHDGRMCGKTETQMFGGNDPGRIVTGTVHVSELVRDGNGAITSFAATYQLNCQVVGQSGLEGSIAMNSSGAPASVPAAPAAPGPVTGLAALNVGPGGGGTNTTTLNWNNPSGPWGDTEVDMVQSAAGYSFSDLVGRAQDRQYVGRADHFDAGSVDFMDGRTYRIVTRGPTGRLGPARYVAVKGTRMSVFGYDQRVTIGQQMTFTGRLNESYPYTDVAHVMDGPPVPGKTLVVCEVPSTHYSDLACDRVGSVVTGADGSFSVTVSPEQNSLYSIRMMATPGMLGNDSRIINAGVSPVADLAAPEASAGARGFLIRGRIIHFSTSGARRGARGVVWLQRYDGHRWRTVLTRRLPRHGRVHRLKIPFRDRAAGRHLYRLVKPGDAHHVAGISRTVHVTVR